MNTNKTTNKTQYLTRDQLVVLYSRFFCTEWRRVIQTYLEESSLREGDYKVAISSTHLNQLYENKNRDMIKACENHGIIRPKKSDSNAFVEVFSVHEIKELSKKLFGEEHALQINYANTRDNPTPKNEIGRSFFLASKYEAKITEYSTGASRISIHKKKKSE